MSQEQYQNINDTWNWWKASNAVAWCALLQYLTHWHRPSPPLAARIALWGVGEQDQRFRGSFLLGALFSGIRGQCCLESDRMQRELMSETFCMPDSYDTLVCLKKEKHWIACLSVGKYYAESPIHTNYAINELKFSWIWACSNPFGWPPISIALKCEAPVGSCGTKSLTPGGPSVDDQVRWGPRDCLGVPRIQCTVSHKEISVYLIWVWWQIAICESVLVDHMSTTRKGKAEMIC